MIIWIRVTSVVVPADDSPSWNPGFFEYKDWPPRGRQEELKTAYVSYEYPGNNIPDNRFSAKQCIQAAENLPVGSRAASEHKDKSDIDIAMLLHPVAAKNETH